LKITGENKLNQTPGEKTLKCITVALVEDNYNYLEEVNNFLADAPSIKVLGKYMTGKEAIKEIPLINPDVSLIDLRMPDMSGCEIVAHISKNSNTECVILTACDGDEDLFSALKSGAVGYLVKSEVSLPELVEAIHKTIDGGSNMSPKIARRILQEFRKSVVAEPEEQKVNEFKENYGLTKTELQILELVAVGNNPKKVAEILFRSYETIRAHLKNIYFKLKVHSLVEALAVYKDK
jgi:DNA-binding NarL/FixJ family response regulator